LEKDFSAEEDGLKVEATVLAMGNDLLVAINGGRSHIGAIGLAQPRPSLRDSSGTSSTSSVLTMLGHKEDDLVKMVSERISSHTGRLTVVVAGVHFDELQAAHVQLVLKLAENLADQIVASFPKDQNT
jgi:gallate decarboxylase subunit D